MTQEHDPYENAVAEGINGILKKNLVYMKSLKTIKI